MQRLAHHPHQVVAQHSEVGLLAKPDGKRWEGLRGVVLPAVEAMIDERLHPAAQRDEQGDDRQSRGDDCDSRLLAGQRAEDALQDEQAPK